MAADAFLAFDEAAEEARTAGVDPLDAESVGGARFRDTVLGLGGSQHPADVFRQFRGREPSIDPLLAVYGLGPYAASAAAAAAAASARM